MKPLSPEVSADRYPRSKTIGIFLAQTLSGDVDTSATRKLLRGQMIRGKRTGTWLRLAGGNERTREWKNDRTYTEFRQATLK